MQEKDDEKDFGRPLLFSNEKELQERIDAYFSECDNRIIEKYSPQLGVIKIKDPEPYTVAGLACFLDCDPKTINNYQKRANFFPAIKRAKNRIEKDVSRRLMETNPTGAIFNLKNNFGWKDKMETENKTELSGGITLTVSEEAKKTVDEILE